MDSSSIVHWREYFRTASGNIFEVIENAITVAAFDFPKDFRIRRDQIVERLYLCQLSRCAGCDRVELAVPKSNVDGGTKYRSSGNSEVIEGKESKVNSSVNDNCDMNLNYSSKYSYHEAEALTAEIEEESQIVGEVLRINDLLSTSENQSEDVIVESLQRLQLMSLSVQTLQATKIGMIVNHLRKHKSKCISNVARTLVKEWKGLVEQWMSVVPDIKGGEGSPDSVNPSVVEEGLPSPPLDEGAFLATQTTSIELSRFFEGMDDDGNLRNCGELDTNHENERKLTLANQRIPLRKIQPSREANFGTKESEGHNMRKKESVNKQTRLSNTEVGSIRPPKPISRLTVNDETKLRQELLTVGAEKISLSGQRDKSEYLNGEPDQMKLEAAKRKLHNGYQQAEKAKKQRTIQVMELHEIPKRGALSSLVRPGSHNRNISCGRR